MKSSPLKLSQVVFGAAVLYIALYFCWFVGGSLRAEFTPDDLMNAAGAFSRPYPALLADNLVFFRFAPNYRPFGTLVYKVFFDWFGFNLGPLRLLLFVVLGANVILVYLLARRLTGSRETGLLAALILSYHAGFGGLYYNTGTLYDIFCFFFYIGALAYYLHIRQKGLYLNLFQMLALCGLYALALDSKEMAVTLPVMIGLYEVLFHWPSSLGWRTVARWVAHEGAATAVSAAMTAAFLLGRMTGPESLPQLGGYRMTVSAGEYLTRTGQYLDQLFYADAWFTPWKTLAVLLLLLAVAWEWRPPALRFCVSLFVLGILPVAFVSLRTLNAAYVPVAGLAIYAAVLLAGGRDGLLGLTARATRLPNARLTQATQFALFILVALLLLKVHPTTEEFYVALQPQYGLIRSVWQQMSRLHPQMPRGGRLLIVTDPLGQFDWATQYVARLLYRDDTLTVDSVAQMNPKPDPAAIAKYDVILTYESSRLIDLKPSNVKIVP